LVYKTLFVLKIFKNACIGSLMYDVMFNVGMMDVLYCILNDSPEALNMMKEEHIKVIISLLEKFGRDPKVLDILCNLCVGSGVAVRSSQNNIVDFLLPGKNLLLHTAVVDHVARY
jgi:ryanodine receptor 2